MRFSKDISFQRKTPYYVSYLSRANLHICLRESYTASYMLERERYPVDHADMLLTVCKPEARSASLYAQKEFPKH